MKKLILSLSFACLAYGAMAQSCTPDQTITSPGTYPDILPDGTAGSYYEESVQFRIPADTNVDFNGTTVNAVIDSIKVVDVKNLPAGVSYACNPSSCALPGGKTSCGVLYGTIDGSAQGTYTFVIPVIIYARVGGAFPLQQPDTIYGLSMNVNTPNSTIRIMDEKLVVYPNPAQGNMNIALTFHAGQAEVHVFDRQGKAVNIEMEKADNVVSINTATLPAGIYYGRVQRGNEIYRFHFIKN